VLAFNAEAWLAEHLNVYLGDPDQYCAILPNLLHLFGHVDYTAKAITITSTGPIAHEGGCDGHVNVDQATSYASGSAEPAAKLAGPSGDPRALRRARRNLGGLEMIRHPLNAFGVTTDLIAGSPSDTFSWPGVLRLVLVWRCALLACTLSCRPMARHALLSGLFGVGLMAWIGAQWALLQDRLWLRPAMFICGAVIAALAGRVLLRYERC